VTGAIGFREVLLINLNFKTKSNALSAYDYAVEIAGTEPVTRQAYEKARDKVKSSAFKELFEDSVKTAVSATDAKLFHGYRVCAVDGSLVLLPKSEPLAEEYGTSTPVEGKTYARTSMCVDVLNGIVLDGEIAGFSVGEREFAKRHIEKDISPDILYLKDRGYWSAEIAALINKAGRKFLIRLAANSVPSVTKSSESSGFFTVRFKRQEHTYRYYKFQLPSGEPEYLATNLSSEDVSDRELPFLYSLRWGIETKYDELKNRLQFEGFNGKSVNVIEQDFYASMVVMNITGFAIAAADVKVKEVRSGKDNTYDYKPNGNMAVGILKNRLIKAVIAENPIFRAEMIDRLIRDISKFVIPIIPDRHVPRSTTAHKQRRKRIPKFPL
jgi:hypothetical protein